MQEPKYWWKPVTRESFFKMFPPETRGIFFTTPDGNTTKIASVGEEVICDLCNNDVFTEEKKIGYILIIGGHICDTYCADCYKRSAFNKNNE